MAFAKLLLILFALLLQICTAAPQLGFNQEVLDDGTLLANSVRKAYIPLIEWMTEHVANLL